MSKTRESIIENQLHVEHQLSPPSRAAFTCHVPDLLSRRCNFVEQSYVTCTVRWVDGVELWRKKGRLLSILAAGSSQRPEWARCTPGGLVGVIPSSRCLPGCSWRVGSSAVPLVRVCAAGMGSVRSWRTWRAAQARMLSLDMLKTGRYLVRLGKIRFSHSDKLTVPNFLLLCVVELLAHGSAQKTNAHGHRW